MNPAKLDFNPHYFNWGTWHYYELGGIIGLAGLLNIVELSKDKYFYYSNPWEMAKIYLTGRFLSVFFALATIFLVYLIGKKMYNKKTALLASFFIAINPAHIVHSHYLKADASVTFWITLLLLGSVFILKTGKLKWYILSGIISAFAMSSQHSGMFFIHTILFAHLLREYKYSITYDYIKNVLFSKKLGFSYLFSCLTYLVINPSLYLSTGEFIRGIHTVIFGQRGVWLNTVFRSNMLVDTIKIFNVSLTAFFLILIIFGIILGFINRAKKNLLLIFSVTPYLAFMIIKSALNTRYQILIFPALFLLTAGAVYDFYTRIKKGYTRIMLIACSIFFSLYTIIYSYAYDKELTKKPIQQEATEWLISHIPAKTKIGCPSDPEITSCPTIIHQDYYYKEHAFYRVINLNNNINALKQEKPDYFTMSKRDTLYDLWKRPAFVADFVKELEKNYTIVKKFERYPSFFNISFKPNVFISDWEIPFPVIYILKNNQAPVQTR